MSKIFANSVKNKPHYATLPGRYTMTKIKLTSVDLSRLAEISNVVGFELKVIGLVDRMSLYTTAISP